MTGHTGEYIMKTTGDYMGIKLTGKLDPCEACAQAKIRQANIPKKKEPKVLSRPGYRLFIDISSFKHESMGGKRHWLIVVDEFSDWSHSFFLLKNLYSQFGLISSCADQFNSWCSPMLRCLFTCIFHNL